MGVSFVMLFFSCCHFSVCAALTTRANSHPSKSNRNKLSSTLKRRAIDRGNSKHEASPAKRNFSRHSSSHIEPAFWCHDFSYLFFSLHSFSCAARKLKLIITWSTVLVSKDLTRGRCKLTISLIGHGKAGNYALKNFGRHIGSVINELPRCHPW